jgi:hypothetical protein
MPLSYTWHLPTFFSRNIKLVNHNLHQQLQTKNRVDWAILGISWQYTGYTIGIRLGYGPLCLLVYGLVYGGIFFGIRLCFPLTLWYTVGIRSVYGWYTVLFLFKPIFAILLFAKPNFGDCLIPKIKSYSGCSASRCAEELNFMMVSNDCESSLHHFPFSQLHFATKLIAECVRQISPQNNGFCSLPQRNANF